MYNNVVKSHEQKMSRRLRHIFFVIYMKIQSLTEQHSLSVCALLRAILPKGRKRKLLCYPGEKAHASLATVFVYYILRQSTR